MSLRPSRRDGAPAPGPGPGSDGIARRNPRGRGREGAAGVVGTTRSKTERFLRYRRAARAAQRPFGAPPGRGGAGEEDTPFGGAGGGGDSRLLPGSAASHLADPERGGGGDPTPAYVAFKEHTEEELRALRGRVDALRQLHARAALSSFDDGREREAEVEAATAGLTRALRACEAGLLRFGAAPAGSENDERVKKNVARTLAVELQRLSSDFRRLQKDHLARVKRREDSGGGRGGKGGKGNGGGGAYGAGGAYDPPSRGPGAVGAEQDLGFSDLQLLRGENLSAQVDERDREVAQIVSSIGELAGIMKDLSVLVIDQGSVLDRIDYNMEQTSASVAEGVRQLRGAEKKQRQGLAATCVMFLVVAIGVMFVILLLKSLIFL